MNKDSHLHTQTLACLFEVLRILSCAAIQSLGFVATFAFCGRANNNI